MRNRTHLALGDVSEGVDQLQPPIFSTLVLPCVLLRLELRQPGHCLVDHAHDGFLQLAVFLGHEGELGVELIEGIGLVCEAGEEG